MQIRSVCSERQTVDDSNCVIMCTSASVRKFVCIYLRTIHFAHFQFTHRTVRCAANFACSSQTICFSRFINCPHHVRLTHLLVRSHASGVRLEHADAFVSDRVDAHTTPRARKVSCSVCQSICCTAFIRWVSSEITQSSSSSQRSCEAVSNFISFSKSIAYSV